MSSKQRKGRVMSFKESGEVAMNLPVFKDSDAQEGLTASCESCVSQATAFLYVTNPIHLL